MLKNENRDKGKATIIRVKWSLSCGEMFMRYQGCKTFVGIVMLAIGLSGCKSQVIQEVDRQPKGEQNVMEVAEPIEEIAITDKVEASHQVRIADYLEEKCKQVFANYYELLTFDIINYVEHEDNGQTEANFWYQILYKNYDKDPDTVGYIKEAKARGDKYYQQLYDEYLATKEMNFEFKAVIDQAGNIILYTDIDPTEQEEWEQVEIRNFILSD